MDYPDYLQPVLLRINPEYGKCVSCDEGWWSLIALCDKELASVDPLYTIFQIKEKFGGLRYYYSPSNPANTEQMNTIVRKHEKICGMTCEATGKHGSLMRHASTLQFKTLNESFIREGWEPRANSDTVITREQD
jgi:hypothetical protein